MATIVTITSNPASTVSLKPANKSFASVAVAPSSNISLGQLTNVDVSTASNNQTLVYNAVSGKFVAGDFTLSSNNIPSIVGGGF